jgi:RNA polymerase sigma factor (sigma-70 family)
MQDQELQQHLEQARAGNRQALETVLTRSRQDLRRFAEYHCALNDVEDAVQESLLLVSRKIGTLRAIEAYTSWLFRIVKRECNRLKRAARHVLMEPADLAEIADIHTPPPTGLIRDIAAALAELPPHYREILLMRDLEGMTTAEIAERLDLHPEAAKARLHRARSLARQYLTVPETHGSEGAAVPG